MDNGEKVGSVLVVGAGIAGMQAALDCANSGFKVYLLEQEPAIGGNMARLDKTFPTNDCSMCMLSPKLVETAGHLNIEIISYADLKKVEGEAGLFTVTVNKRSRFVDEEKCTGCGDCWNNCLARHRIEVPERKSVRDELDAEMLTTLDGFVEPDNGHPPALMGILQEIQRTYSYLPEAALRYVSEREGVHLSQIYAVATFYKTFSFEPKGKHIIRVCTGTACHLKGSHEILDALESKLAVSRGGTTRDRIFTLETVNCLGCCALSPVMTIGEKYFGNLDITKLDPIIEGYYEADDG